MSATLVGSMRSGRKTNNDGHRDYNITWLVESDNVDDGPGVVGAVAGLPVVGSAWTFGNDNDAWAFCWPTQTIRETVKDNGEWTGLWTIEQLFSTRPMSRCQTARIEDPLAEPIRLSGSFVRATREATHDRQGNVLLTSSRELIRGIEKDDSNATVKVGMNLASLPLFNATSLRGHVNNAGMWGLERRMVQLKDFVWQRHLFGTCTYYYTVDYTFEINFRKYIDTLVDKGTRVLVENGNPDNPEDWVPYRHPISGDRQEVLLDGEGGLLTDLSNPVTKDAEVEFESDLFVLGLPASL